MEAASDSVWIPNLGALSSINSLSLLHAHPLECLFACLHFCGVCVWFIFYLSFYLCFARCLFCALFLIHEHLFQLKYVSVSLNRVLHIALPICIYFSFICIFISSFMCMCTYTSVRTYLSHHLHVCFPPILHPYLTLMPQYVFGPFHRACFSIFIYTYLPIAMFLHPTQITPLISSNTHTNTPRRAFSEKCSGKTVISW